jgi:hypothetical protein
MIDFVQIFGPWGASLAVLATMMFFFMRRMTRADDSRREIEKLREQARDEQSLALVQSMRDSLGLLTRAVDRFEAFEREEIRTHSELFAGMKGLIDSQNRIIETQSRLGETLARIADTQLQQKFLMRDIVKELKEARADRREQMGMPPEQNGGFDPELPNGS